MANPFPPITIPPKTTKGGISTKAVFDQYMRAHPGLAKWSAGIWDAATEWGVDPVYFASMLNTENAKGDPNAISSAGAIGLGQVMPGKTAPWLGPNPISASELRNPTLNLRVAAWYLRQGLDQNGDNYKAAYTAHYNPGYTGKIFTDVPKGYISTAGTQSPTQKANTSVDVTLAKAANQEAQFSTAKQILDPIYLAYTGKKATENEIQRYLANPVSTYEIETRLSDPKANPGIFTSPIWQTQSAKYQAVYQNIYGPNAATPKKVILYAIVHNLDQTSFDSMLRNDQLKGQGAPSYTTSEDYKQKSADATTAYTNIMGPPDPGGQAIIANAIRNGWNQNQLELYLRQQPGYTNGPEYKRRAITLAQSMGLIQPLSGQGPIGQTALAGTGGATPQPLGQMPGEGGG